MRTESNGKCSVPAEDVARGAEVPFPVATSVTITVTHIIHRLSRAVSVPTVGKASET